MRVVALSLFLLLSAVLCTCTSANCTTGRKTESRHGFQYPGVDQIRDSKLGKELNLGPNVGSNAGTKW